MLLFFASPPHPKMMISPLVYFSEENTVLKLFFLSVYVCVWLVTDKVSVFIFFLGVYATHTYIYNT